MKVSIGVSNRHVHITKEHLEILFGKNYELKKLKDLNQPGQFGSTDVVKIVGPSGEIDNVRIIGPVRSYTQIEVSATDAFKLGVKPPVRKSGDVIGSSPIKVVGPSGEIDLKEGCILADRHIHITPKQLELYGYKENDVVNIFVDGEKSVFFKNVVFKVDEESYFELHIDLDAANAAGLKNGDIVDIIY